MSVGSNESSRSSNGGWSGNDDPQQVRRRGLLLLFVVLLGVLGVADGTYLSLVHVDYELGNPSELTQVCSKFASRGCAVTTGRFGALFGIPVALLGLGGAAATTVVAAVAWFHRRERHDGWRGTAFALGAFSVLVSLVMAIFSSLEGSFCPFCVAWYGINFGLGIATWLALGYDQDASLGKILRDALHLPGLAALAAFMLAFSVGYWFYGARRGEAEAKSMDDTRANVARLLQQPAVEIDLSSLPARGPEDATLTIVEVADFQCPYCRRVWEGIHDYTEHATPSVRVAFIHYPLDGKCNPGIDEIHPFACLAAQAAECARREQKFWEYGDLLFANQGALAREDLLAYAERLGLDPASFSSCLDDEQVKTEVRTSIARAILLGVEATPTFFVNGRKIKGALPKAVLPLALDEFARAAAADLNRE